MLSWKLYIIVHASTAKLEIKDHALVVHHGVKRRIMKSCCIWDRYIRATNITWVVSDISFTVFKFYFSLSRWDFFHIMCWLSLYSGLFCRVVFSSSFTLHTALEQTNWWITLIADFTDVNDNVLQRGLQGGKVYQSKLQLIYWMCWRKQEDTKTVENFKRCQMRRWTWKSTKYRECKKMRMKKRGK